MPHLLVALKKINNRLIDNAEDLDIVMPMYNLTKYSKNYRKTTGSLWNYYRDEPNSGLGGDDNNINYSIENSNILIIKQAVQENCKTVTQKKTMLKLLHY